jgi:hypothetical protein
MSREVLDSRSSYDELYEDRPDEGKVPRSRGGVVVPAALSTRLRSLAPLAAFLVGLAVGGAGWNEWLAQREVAEGRATVSFSARVSRADATPHGIEAYVRLANNGPAVVQLHDVRINDRAVMSSSWREGDSIDVPAGDEATSKLFLQVNCRPRGAASEPALAIRVQTADGTMRSAELPLEDDSNRLADATAFLCPEPGDGFLPLDVAYSGPLPVVDNGGRTLQTPVSISSWMPVDVTVLEIRPATRKLSVSVEGLPLTVSTASRDRAVVTLTWHVDDCFGTEDLPFESLGFFIDAERVSGDIVTVRVLPEPDLALDVAAFVADTCQSA